MLPEYGKKRQVKIKKPIGGGPHDSRYGQRQRRPRRYPRDKTVTKYPWGNDPRPPRPVLPHQGIRYS